MMKLHELGAQRQTQQIARVIESQLGRQFDLDRVGSDRLPGMLRRVQGLLAEHRRGPQWHASERDGAYLNLVMMERAIQARITELDQPAAGQTTAAQATAAQTIAATKDPKMKAVLTKASKGQNLNPDEQKMVAGLALMKTEGRRRRLREQNELQQAQVVLASQDMVDRLQGMLEDISEMQFKDLPALTDSIKQDMGVDQANQFQAQASQALTTLLQALQAGKTEMEAAQGVLTGEPMTVPGQPATDQGMAAPDMTNMAMPAKPAPAPELPAEPAATDNAALGRERR